MTSTFSDGGATAALFCQMHEDAEEDGESGEKRRAYMQNCEVGRKCADGGEKDGLECCLEMAKSGGLEVVQE